MSDVLHKWDGAFTHECHSISVEADTVASGTGCGGGGVEEQLALRDWWHSLTINTVTAVIIAVVSGVLPPAAVPASVPSVADRLERACGRVTGRLLE